MPTTLQTVLEPPPGFRSDTVARFLWQLDEQRRTLLDDTRDLARFDRLLGRARTHTRRVAMTLADADLAREVRRRRPDGTERVLNVGWVLYHMLEHEAGHHGQINLLRHLEQLRAPSPRE